MTIVGRGTGTASPVRDIHPATVRHIDCFDRHLLTFVLTWAPFGGPDDEDTFSRFGLPSNSVWDRFYRIVEAAEPHLGEFDDADADLIRRASSVDRTRRIG
ncbi:hypothetical protein JDV09_17630 [Mycobacterium sp. Y57]|uniref:hypothetical protein n=1 Tax=Mycolicibacterium xanthum TaxID=2796469 RepID=UPI001C852EAA|nr:hypothetical protein [Mycolicibacterium xanthum]MBX7433917.1 hypothetical protein [Mycolicibacterium xanthum]